MLTIDKDKDGWGKLHLPIDGLRHITNGEITIGEGNTSILLQRGQTFHGRIRLANAGKFYDRPFVFGSYGDLSKPRPIIDASSITIAADHVAVVGVELRGGGSISVVAGVKNVTIEDVGVFDALKNGITINARKASVDNVVIRRCQIVGSMGQGVFLRGVSNLLFEENLVYNSGPKGADGLATFNARVHSIYKAREGSSHTYRNNLLGRASNMGLKLRAPLDGLIIDGNFVWDCYNGIGLSFDGDDVAAHPDWGFSGSIINNVITGNGREGGGFGLEVGYARLTIIKRNLIVANTIVRSGMQFKHKHPEATTRRAGMIIADNTISHNGRSIPIRWDSGALTGPDNFIRDNILQADADGGRQVLRGFDSLENPITLHSNSLWSPKRLEDWVQSGGVNGGLDLLLHIGDGTVGTAERVAFEWEKHGDLPPAVFVPYAEEYLAEQRRGNWDEKKTAEYINKRVRADWTVTSRTAVEELTKPDPPDVPRRRYKISQQQLDDARGELRDVRDSVYRALLLLDQVEGK